MKRYGPVIAGSIVAGVICWFFGIGLLPAIVVTIAIASIGIVLRVPGSGGPNTDWPAAPLPPTDGDRRESAELSWAIRTRGGTVDARIVRRIRGIAESRLALRQLDLDNPAQRSEIHALIGASTYDVLTSAKAPRIRMNDVTTILDTLDRLHDRTATPQVRASAPLRSESLNGASTNSASTNSAPSNSAPTNSKK